MIITRSLMLVLLSVLAGFMIAGCQGQDPPLAPTNPQAAQQSSSQPAVARPGKGATLGGAVSSGGGANPGSAPTAH
jgi:hypothetical protein